jgi:hypothetical protein
MQRLSRSQPTESGSFPIEIVGAQVLLRPQQSLNIPAHPHQLNPNLFHFFPQIAALLVISGL